MSKNRTDENVRVHSERYPAHSRDEGVDPAVAKALSARYRIVAAIVAAAFLVVMATLGIPAFSYYAQGDPAGRSAAGWLVVAGFAALAAFMLAVDLAGEHRADYRLAKANSK